MACTNRIHLYARGFTQLGHKVLIVVPRPTESQNNIQNSANQGIHEGIGFRYSSPSTVRSRYFLSRRINDINSYRRAIAIAVRYKPDAIINVSDFLSHFFIAKVASILTKALLLSEQSEVPYFQKERLNWLERIITRLEFSQFNGIIAITQNLKKFFTEEIEINIRTTVVPILVDPFRPAKNCIISDNIVYSGSLSNRKDGIFTILKAFSLFAIVNKDAKLVLTGDLNNSGDKDKILEIVQNNGMGNRIFFTGYLHQDNLAELMSSARLLICLKPDNRQNRYNFATKLAEYLLSGRPVILTKIDPICEYLENRVSACIINSEINEIAKEIHFLFDNSVIADEIGKKGKLVAISKLNYQEHCLRMINFMQSF